MNALRRELGRWWPIWIVLYGIVCGASGAASLQLIWGFHAGGCAL